MNWKVFIPFVDKIDSPTATVDPVPMMIALAIIFGIIFVARWIYNRWN